MHELRELAHFVDANCEKDDYEKRFNLSKKQWLLSTTSRTSKHRLKHQLLHGLFFLKKEKIESKRHSDIYVAVQNEYFLQVLSLLGGESIALSLAEKKIKKIQSFGLTEYVLKLANFLKEGYSARGDVGKYIFYRSVYSEYRELLLAEWEAEDWLQDINLKIISAQLSHKDIMEHLHSIHERFSRYNIYKSVLLKALYSEAEVLLSLYREDGYDKVRSSIEGFFSNSCFYSWQCRRVYMRMIYYRVKATCHYGYVNTLNPVISSNTIKDSPVHEPHCIEQSILVCIHQGDYKRAIDIVKEYSSSNLNIGNISKEKIIFYSVIAEYLLMKEKFELTRAQVLKYLQEICNLKFLRKGD